MCMKVKRTINIWVDSNCVQVVGFGTQWDCCIHRHPVALEVLVHVCVKLHGSPILIITQQPSPLLTFLTSLQRSRVRRLCYSLRAITQYLKSLLVIFFAGKRWTWYMIVMLGEGDCYEMEINLGDTDLELFCFCTYCLTCLVASVMLINSAI